MSLNSVVIEGRLTRDPELRATEGGASITRFSVAVDRDRLNRDGKREADYISCIAFNKTAEFIDKHFNKGKGISVVGRIQSGSYKNQEGKTVYTTDVVVDRVSFPVGNPKGENSERETEEQEQIPAGFEKLTDDDIPF